ncbi:hypothetical protein R5R35_009842 [Gryllus longicercus]|uniref:Uncharacterized protein n=1 Tax=Gryllus longicercus TaxID=2509291 RepID=A0AAN9ZDR6_9ORTH
MAFFCFNGVKPFKQGVEAESIRVESAMVQAIKTDFMPAASPPVHVVAWPLVSGTAAGRRERASISNLLPPKRQHCGARVRHSEDVTRKMTSRAAPRWKARVSRRTSPTVVEEQRKRWIERPHALFVLQSVSKFLDSVQCFSTRNL